MSSTNTPTLAAYLPVLTHPEHGPAICRAAGVEVKETYIALLGTPGFSVSIECIHDAEAMYGPCQWLIAAISHGIAAWLAEADNGIDPNIMHTRHGDWAVFNWRVENGYDVTEEVARGPTLPAALLAAAERVLGVE